MYVLCRVLFSELFVLYIVGLVFAEECISYSGKTAEVVCAPVNEASAKDKNSKYFLISCLSFSISKNFSECINLSKIILVLKKMM